MGEEKEWPYREVTSLTSLRGDLNFEILTFHVRARRSRDSAGEPVDVEKIEKNTTPGEYIEWTLAYRRDKTFVFVGERWQNVKGRNEQRESEGASVFGRGRWMLRNENDSFLRRDAERINELSCCVPDKNYCSCEQMEANGSIFTLAEHARKNPSAA